MREGHFHIHDKVMDLDFTSASSSMSGEGEKQPQRKTRKTRKSSVSPEQLQERMNEENKVRVEEQAAVPVSGDEDALRDLVRELVDLVREAVREEFQRIRGELPQKIREVVRDVMKDILEDKENVLGRIENRVTEVTHIAHKARNDKAEMRNRGSSAVGQEQPLLSPSPQPTTLQTKRARTN